MIILGILLILAALWFDEGESKAETILTGLCFLGGASLTIYSLITILIS